MVHFNGKEVDADGVVLKDYLEQNGFAAGRIAVERNEEIVPKSDYGICVLRDGDTVEVVSFVGGG